MESKVRVTTLIQIGFPSSKKFPKNMTYCKKARCLFNPIIEFSPLAFASFIHQEKKKKKSSLQQPVMTLDLKQT